MLVRPHHDEAERALLGSLLLDADAADAVADIITVADLYYARHQAILRAIHSLRDDGEPAADAVLLARRLESTGDLQKCGGPAYLERLMASVPHSLHAEYYAREVREAADRRRFIETCDVGMRSGRDETCELPDALAAVEQSLHAIIARSVGSRIVEMRDAVPKLLESLQRRDAPALATGWPDLDHALGGGLRAGHLPVIADRPGKGKSALGANLALYVASLGRVVLVVSLEQSERELTLRLLSSLSGLPHVDIKQWRLSEWQQERLASAGEQLRGLPLLIDDTPGRTIAEIAAAARLYVRR